MTTRISFIPTPRATGTYIEYSFDGGAWIVPTSAPNPTTLSYYDLTFTAAGTYVVRLSTISPSCSPFYKYITIVVSSSACCPGGYTLAPDGTYCYEQNTVAPTPPETTYVTVAENNTAYSTCGSYIYAPGYASDGTGSSSQISVSNPFWVNGPGDCGTHTTTDGPLNRSGLWSTSLTSNQDVGFSICFNLMSTKQYYVGVGCDNYSIIKLDGVTVITQNEAAINAQYTVTGACFKVWHIYPITMSSGPHILEAFGHNVTGAAGMGVEIYDNTAGEIASASSYAALDLVFSTKDHIGDNVSSGTDGYICPSGYSLTCDSSPECVQTLTTATISC